MNEQRASRWIAGIIFALLFLQPFPLSAQTFVSGSTGADGAFVPCTPTPCTVTVTLPPDGVLNYTTVNVPSGVTVTFVRNAANTPVTMLATGDVTIAGTISVNGGNGASACNSGVNPNCPAFFGGGSGGPGGFSGGSGGMIGQTNSNGSYGQGPGGGVGTPISSQAIGGTFGAPSGFVSLIPLFGGSGGGGAGGNSTIVGPSGGGGGGAIVIASTTKITVASTGVISANGGDSGGRALQSQASAGEGSGGAIRLVAPEITSTGTIRAMNGIALGNPGGPGVIRLEAFTFGTVNATTPGASFSVSPGPVTAASTPSLAGLPTLAISSVGGIAAPANPGGAYATADVSLPLGTTNPVPVTLIATNTPIGTTITLSLLPQFGSSTIVPGPITTSGSFASSTASANVTFPSGEVSLLLATASFTITSTTAALFPLMDGEPVERVMVAANYGEPSTVTLITKSGKEVRADRLPVKDQLAFAKGWEAMQRAKE
jgi:hypothetical protein